MLTLLSCRSIILAFRKGAIVRDGQIDQTDAYFNRPTVVVVVAFISKPAPYIITILKIIRV